MKLGTWLCLFFLAGSLRAAEVVITTNNAQTNSTPISPLPLTNAFRGIQLKRGFRLELVAAEPLVANPGAMAFDENGRLFVVETPDGQPGRVRLLEDTDGDGVFDASRVYAENVYGATSLACYDGGVFVGAGTEVLYLKDTSAGGSADSRRVVFSSFGEATNGAGGLVSFTAMVWGMDNQIHVATVGHGGDIISSSQPKQSVVLSGGCFSFDPRTLALVDESGGGASGMSFDIRGRRFISSPANHLQMVMYESRYAKRNPLWQMPDALLDASGPNLIYPVSGTTTMPARFSAATGLMFYRGYLFPVDYVDNPFVADPGAGVVHRDRLRANGLEVTAERAPDEAGTEFLRVSDGSFRPTAFACGPEGALYVAGPAKQPAVVTPGKSASANNSANRGFGRIYRVVPANFKQRPPTQLGEAKVTDLVNALRHPNGWNRESAARLLYQRQDRSAVVPLIQLLYDLHSPPLGRVYAMQALDSLHKLLPGHLARGLNDADDRVRERAILLSEKLLTNTTTFPDLVWGPLAKAASDASPQVRYQLAFTLGQCRNPGRVQALADTLRNDATNRWLQAAALSSLNEGAGEMLRLLAADGSFRANASGRDFLAQLAVLVGEKNQPDDVAQAMRAIAGIPEAETAFRLARRLGDGLQFGKSSLTAADTQGILRQLYAVAARMAVDMKVAEPARVQAVRLMDAANVWDPVMNGDLIRMWYSHPPKLKNAFATALLSQPNRTSTLIYALQAASIPMAQLSTFQVRFLLAEPDTNLRRQAAALYGNPAIPSRQNIVNRYAGAAQMTGSKDRGRVHFVARCGDCHQLGNDGDPRGMSLKAAAGAAKADLLAKIVDPNRNISGANSAAIVMTADGRTLPGNIIANNANGIILCQPDGTLRFVGAQNVQSQIGLGISAMAEGLEAGMSQQDMADLLEFLSPSAPQ